MNIIDKFKTQRVSQVIHFKNRLPGQRQHRVENCHRLKRNRSHQVTLRKKPGATRAHYGDYQTCGSVWVDPVCSSIISEGRSQDTQTAINIWRSMDTDNCIIHAAITSPHTIFQTLEGVLSVQDKAFRIMNNQPIKKSGYTRYKAILANIGSIGNNTGRDITFGLKNGWHPHRHIIYFCKRQTVPQLKRIRFDLSVAFANSFLRAGGQIPNINDFMQYAVKVDQITDDDGYQRISSYVTSVEGDKWTLAKEATKGITKKAKNGNITPFGMLDAIHQGDKKSGIYSLKYYEYAKTMHGKKQFFSSPGLSDHLGLKDKTDKDIMEERETGNHFYSFTDEQINQIHESNIKGEIIVMTEGINEFQFMTELELYLNEIKNQKKDLAS